MVSRASKFLMPAEAESGYWPMGLEGWEFVQRHVQHQGLRVDYFQEIGVARSGGHHFWPVRESTGGFHLLHRLQGERTSESHPGTATHPGTANSSADSRTADSSADSRTANSSANTSPGTAPVLHWSRRGVHCPLLFGRVVRRERIQLLGLCWELVRRLFADASSTNTRGEPKSYTSGSGASGSRPKCVLLRPGMHRQLRCRRVVRWGREQLCWLRGRVVQLSISACVQLHDEAGGRPQRLSEVDR